MTENASLIYKDQLVRSLGWVLQQSGHSLRMAPSLVKLVIIHHAWQDRFVTALQCRQRYDDFPHFVADQPPCGLGTDLATLTRLCADDQEALDLLDRVTATPDGARLDASIRDLQASTSIGGEDQEARQALRDDARTAMLEAGLRRVRMTLYLDEPETAARAIKRATSPAYVQALIEALQRDKPAP